MIAIQGSRIITMEGGVIEGGIILVEGQFIQAVGENLEIPTGAAVVDAQGKYILPGLIDAHTHIGLDEEIYRIEGDDVNETSDPITPQLQAVDGINFMDLAFADALRGGVTRAMCMPGSANILGGQAVFLKTLALNPAAMICRNPWGLKAALGENPKRVYGAQKKAPKTRMANASLLREALFNARGCMDKPDLKANELYRNEAIFKVLRGEMPLLLHVHRADDILTALRIKDEFGIEMQLQHGTEAALVADELVKRDVPVALGPLFSNRAKVEMKEVSFRNAALLAERGVRFCFITDHPVIPIEHLRVCAALAVREGLAEEAALASITSTPAEMLKLDHELGTITPGKRADLAVYSGHPLDFRSRVERVMVDGNWWEQKFE
ncbi:MAG: amidohydrolase [Syntrophomonadaceae bacterium]|nr:amidohydrolase [Syntrophomonadaceae bacterium]